MAGVAKSMRVYKLVLLGLLSCGVLHEDSCFLLGGMVEAD